MVNRNRYIAEQKLFAASIRSDHLDEDLYAQQYQQRGLKSGRRNRVGRARRPTTNNPNLNGFHSFSSGESKRDLIAYCLPGADELIDQYESAFTSAHRHSPVHPRRERQNVICHRIDDIQSTTRR